MSSWAGVAATEALIDGQEELQKNREAESAKVRKQLWDADDKSGQDDEMRQTVLGDINHPAPIIMQQPQQNNTLATVAALAAMIAAGGMGGYLLANKSGGEQEKTVSQPNFQDSSVDIRLGKIEDYLSEN